MNRMTFRKANIEELDQVLTLIVGAQQYLHQQGVDQWQNGYPNREAIVEDIKRGWCHVLVEDENIIGTLALIEEEEPTYREIEEGEWLNADVYHTIHRVAVAADYRRRGIAKEMFDQVKQCCAEKGIKNIKIDTHQDNQVMQRFLTHNHFVCCGIIYLQDGEKRLGFHYCA